jgi:hypothetical protein
MIGRRVVVLGLAFAGALSLALAACVDLFHSTDFENACEVDARAPGCGDAGSKLPDASDAPAEAAPVNFCNYSASEARAHAEHACLWLGACASPFDQNAFGQCMIDGILAFDCAANPNSTIALGPLHEYWTALSLAKTCTEVTAAVNPISVACSGTGYACVGSAGPHARLECIDGKVRGSENCLVEGRVCANQVCSAPKPLASCKSSKCEGTVLHDCEGTADEGYDCQYFGGGACTVSDAGSTCEPSFAQGSSGSGSCFATKAVTCGGDAGNTATACPTGASVTVDCRALTGSSSCHEGTPTPEWNVAAACEAKESCTPGCAGDALVGCAQGAKFTASCSGAGLGTCEAVTLPESMKGYACKAP